MREDQHQFLTLLGNSPPNGIKFFSTADLLELTKDRAWLVKVTNAVNQHWQHQNARRKGRSVRTLQNSQSPDAGLAAAA